MDTFVEGSARRLSFLSGLAAVLRISEKQIIIVSVTAGSVIVELAFVRVDGALVSPTEAVLRLKTAASSGQLEKFGLTGLTVGQENVFEKSSESANIGVTVGASVGGSVAAIIVIAAVVWWCMRPKKPPQVACFFCIVAVPLCF